MEPQTVDEKICELKMNSLTEKIGLMLKPIIDGIARVEGDIGSLKRGAASFVPMSMFQEKCREIEEIKKFVWKVSGGLALVAFLLGLAAKLIK